MIGYFFFVPIAVLSAVILNYFGRQARMRRLARSSRRRLPYRCVAIRCHEDLCCNAVKTLANTRILCRFAPLFPLFECDRVDCQCWYEHFDDRRQEDRRDHYSRTSRDYSGPEKRIRNGDRRRHVTD